MGTRYEHLQPEERVTLASLGRAVAGDGAHAAAAREAAVVAQPALALMAAGLVLTPFTPDIRDIRKAKTEQPAQLVAADDKRLAEYRWVKLGLGLTPPCVGAPATRP